MRLLQQITVLKSVVQFNADQAVQFAELPEIKIVRHASAVRLRLRVEPNTIRLTVPLRCSQKQIQHFLGQSEQWLLDTWQQQQKQKVSTLPAELSLFNLDQSIQVTYQSLDCPFIFHIAQQQLWVSDQQPEQHLKAFVLSYAKEHLPDYLQQLSRACDLPFAKCTIRQPKTRWGSCSAKHDVMLHAGLVLFPPEIVRYVAVHELAHTRHFDHSAKFWAKVYQHDANFQQHRYQLKNRALPDWWHALK